MNPISFDTYIRRDASRNGWDNCEPDADGTGRWLSSTAHEGLLHVFPEGDLFVIVPTYQPICRVPLAELASTLRGLAQTDTAPKGEPPLRTERQQMMCLSRPSLQAMLLSDWRDTSFERNFVSSPSLYSGYSIKR